MKKMLYAALAAFIVVPAMALAQGGPPGAPHQGGMMGGRGGMQNPAAFQKMREKRQKEMRDRLVKELKMTPAQTKAYDARMKVENAAMTKMFQSGKRPDRATFDKMRKEHEDSMRKIFTKDQFAKYTKIMDEERKKRMQGRPGMGGPGMGGRPGTPPPSGGH